MNVKNAAIRAFRTFVQGVTAALGVFYVAVQADGKVDIIDIEVNGEVLVFGVFLAAVSALISAGQNLVEDNTDVDVPKG